MNKLIFFIPFLLIALHCQSRILLKHPPKIGQFFVFDGLLEEQEIYGEQVLKVKNVTTDSVTFFIPQIELAFEFDPHKDEKLIKQEDKKGNIYAEAILQISKRDLAQYERNFEENRDGVQLIWVFE